MTDSETTRTKHFCFRCNKDTPLLHSCWEGVNPTTRTHWLVNYCPKCGTVTSVDQSLFDYSNLLPRIGQVKSFLFVALLIGTPFHLAAWLLGGEIVGIVISTSVLVAAILVSRSEVYQVETCPYTSRGQYPELVNSKSTTDRKQTK